jgi:hypothetical protein
VPPQGVLEGTRRSAVERLSWTGLDHLMVKKSVSSVRPVYAPKASCYDLISMLEHQLRTARMLLGELSESSSGVTQRSTSLIVDYCAELRAEAVEVVKATAMLQDEVCGPADSMRKMNTHAEINALLERITGFWAQLPRTRPDSKAHQALVGKIQVESAAYLKMADAERGVDRKANERATGPAG